MSRPRKTANPTDNGTEPKKRTPRVDPTPFKVYFKHFVSNLSLGALVQGKDVLAVFMCDSVTHNYSDVTEIDALKAAAKKMFKSRKEQTSLVAQFGDGNYAKTFLDSFMEFKSNMPTEPVTPVIETETETA